MTRALCLFRARYTYLQLADRKGKLIHKVRRYMAPPRSVNYGWDAKRAII